MNRTFAAFLLLAIAAPAAHVLASARLTGVPAPGTSLRAGELTTLRFNVADEDADVDEMELLLSLDGGKTFSLRVTKEMSAGTHEVRWRVPNLPTTTARSATASLEQRSRHGRHVLQRLEDDGEIGRSDRV